jgi:hypothetical protein
MEMDDQPQERVSDLKAMAEAKFVKLSRAEKLLLEKVSTGDFAGCGPSDEDKDNNPKDADNWGPERQIRAPLLGWLCMDQEARKHIHWRGIQVHGADIAGSLDLSFVNIPFALTLLRCRLKEGIYLQSAEVSQLALQGSLVHWIIADGVIVKGDVSLSDGFVAVGQVRLPGAQIGRDLQCFGGIFTNPPQKKKSVLIYGTAVLADGINVKGSVFLNRPWCK